MMIVRFDPEGGPIFASVSSGFAQPGSYTLYLWEAHANKIVLKTRGNFLNTDDDEYKLPRPNLDNDGRIVECLTTVVITPPIDDFTLRLSIYQNGAEIGADQSAGKSNSPTVTADLFVQLVSL
jgi:hypothetical protein